MPSASAPPAPDQASGLVLRSGSLYLDAAVCERYLPGLESVGLLLEGNTLFVLPVHDPAAGGLLLKVRNRAGDRVVHGSEFLRDHGLRDDCDLEPEWQWSGAMHALAITLPPELVTPGDPQ